AQQITAQQPVAPEPQPPARDEPTGPPVPPMVFGRSEAPASPERSEAGRPGPVRGGRSRGAALRGARRGRSDRDRGRGEPSVSPLPAAGRGDLGSGRSDLARNDLSRNDLGR